MPYLLDYNDVFISNICYWLTISSIQGSSSLSVSSKLFFINLTMLIAKFTFQVARGMEIPDILNTQVTKINFKYSGKAKSCREPNYLDCEQSVSVPRHDGIDTLITSFLYSQLLTKLIYVQIASSFSSALNSAGKGKISERTKLLRL